MIISRVPLIAADIILIYITWKKLRGLVTLTDVRQSKRLTLADILFRGGMSGQYLCSWHCSLRSFDRLTLRTGIIYFVYVPRLVDRISH